MGREAGAARRPATSGRGAGVPGARSPIAPVGGHFLLHSGISLRGLSMPPYWKTLRDEAEAPARPLAA